MNTLRPDIRPISEKAVSVGFGQAPDMAAHECVLALSLWLSEHPLPGMLSLVPAYTTLGLVFDPIIVRQAWPMCASPAWAVSDFLKKLVQTEWAQVLDFQKQFLGKSARRIHEIRVQYGGPDGPDLPEVARRLCLTEREVVALHTSTAYTVFMIGFLPGFPYLGFLPERLFLPRKDKPRAIVPAGSVAIAERQTGIYPQASPGGWHLIGRTDATLFAPEAETPCLLKTGDLVRWVED